MDIKVYTLIPYKGIQVNIFLRFFFNRDTCSFMPTEKPKIIFVADDDLFKRIDDFRFENRINSRSEAIRVLIENALALYEAVSAMELFPSLKNDKIDIEKRIRIERRNGEIVLASLKGKTRREVAEDFGISERTVSRVLSSVTVNFKALMDKKKPS
ncbi:MAG: helix-turn-helix domain-containing protein [Desulfobacteraceae bacterium]|nr:helix-turn-helix domain-containing protein [Desulfobacteraceae bacterium]